MLYRWTSWRGLSKVCKSKLGFVGESVCVSEVVLGCLSGVLVGIHHNCVSQNWVVWAKVYVLMR